MGIQIKIYKILNQKKKILIIGLLLSICHGVKSQNLDNVISNIFFSANLNGEELKIKNYFDTLKQLTLADAPPRIGFNLGNDSSIVETSYNFEKYKLLKFKFEKGSLNIGAIKITSGLLILNVSIFITFQAKANQLLAYNSFKKYLNQYPFKKIKTKIGNDLIQEIKFKNIGKSGCLSLSIGKFYDKFYIYIYNSRINF